MDDVELDDLVRRFQALQKDSSVDQITERNVVEIVNALLKKKLVELLYTTDAKEYLTWDELKREIVEEVHVSGGRLNVVDVPGLLSVNTCHVERVLPAILAADPTLRIEGGELMTDQYLDATVQSVSDTLKEHGSLLVTQFAAKHQFTSAFALALLTRAVSEGRLSAVVQDSALYTKRFVQAQRLAVRSGLLAAEEPVDVNALYKRHNLFAPLMNIIIAQLDGKLPGTFHGHIYTPSAFEAFRDEQVHNIYSSNGVVTYGALQALGISNAKQYLVGRYNPGGGGDNTAAPAATPSATASHGGRGRRRGGKGNAGAKAASSSTAILRADDSHPHCGHPLTSCFVSDRTLNGLLGLQPIIDGEVLALDMAQQLPAAVELARDWPLLMPRLHELYPALRNCTLVEDAVLLRSDAEQKTKPQLEEAIKAEATCSKPGVKKGSSVAPSSKAAVEVVARRAIAKALRLPEDQYGAVLSEIVEQWWPTVDEVVRQVEAAKKDSASAERKQSRSALQASLASAWVELVIAAKGLQWAKAQLDEPTHAALSVHCLTARGLLLCRCVILNESLDRPELHAAVVAALEQTTTLGNFKKCLAPFPEKVRAALNPLVTALEEKRVEKLMDVLQEMSGDGTIAVPSFYTPNKKVERETSARMREALVKTVKSGSFGDDAAANGNLLASLASLLTMNLFRAYIEIPGKAVSGVVARLIKEAEAPPQLAVGLAAVTAALQSGSTDAATIATLEELRASTLA